MIKKLILQLADAKTFEKMKYILKYQPMFVEVGYNYIFAISNIANVTGRVEYKHCPTKISPDIEELYFELEDKGHVFQIGIKTILECILFGVKEKQLPNLPLTWYTEICSRYDIPLSDLLGDD